MTRQITHAEVKKHASESSVWTIIHHEVYDVTKFLDEHPGGSQSLLDYAGIDGTQAFEDVGHSDDAREMMKKYKIGEIPLNERVDMNITDDKTCSSNLKWAIIALASALVIGFALKKYLAK